MNSNTCLSNDDLLAKYLHQLEELRIPGILEMFCQNVGPVYGHSQEFIKIKQLYAAKITLEWANNQEKIADMLRMMSITA